MMPLKAEVTHQLNDPLRGRHGCFGAGNLVDVKADIPY